MAELKKLNLGAGESRKEGFINVDWQPSTHPDVVHDLNAFPYPFEDGTFDEIEAFHVIEHLDRPFDVMRELHRILKPGGLLHVKVPHFSRGFTHAEHAHGFDITFPLYFNKNFTSSGYFGVEFDLISMRLNWLAFQHLFKYMGYGPVLRGLLAFFNAVITFVANVSPAFASRIWCFWVGGFDELDFRFSRPKKSSA
jgi:SAM-dependent methyltransferase